MHEMSGADASFLYFETPASHMHILATMLVDTSGLPGWGVDEVVTLFTDRLDLMPMLRRRVIGATLRLHHPVWADLDTVDVASHVRGVRLASPGLPALAEEVARFAEHKLDRRRPLWEVLVVTGVGPDAAAVVVKIHHCATDGVGAARLMAAIFDLRREGPTDDEIAAMRADLSAERKAEPGMLDVARHTITGLASWPLKTAAVIPDAVRSVVRLVGLHGGSSDTDGGAMPFTAPRLPFNGRITPGRVVAYVDLQLADVKTIRKAVGGTFNDAIIAICGGALRHYLAERGELPDSSAVGVVPMSVRGTGDTSANAVSAMFTTLATDVADPLERLRVVQRANAVGKSTQAAMGDQLLARVSELAPPTVTAALARAYSGLRLADLHPVVHNLVISNVPGPQFEIYLAGAAVTGLYPLGPVLEGAGLNITLVSYQDRVDVGLIACSDALPALADLASAFPVAVQELLSAIA